ncbi:hypothetical protein [Acetobacter syzygii]|uniref:hypothetical protein n=1 Tax=Acetobacter syzygii TaxID=146476 RepID=UPI00117847B3|nr:hypothetical protein [Acetobacter syzygii]NSL92748.1 hypothetical protein [Acetobacter syzygii]
MTRVRHVFQQALGYVYDAQILSFLMISDMSYLHGLFTLQNQSGFTGESIALPLTSLQISATQRVRWFARLSEHLSSTNIDSSVPALIVPIATNRAEDRFCCALQTLRPMQPQTLLGRKHPTGG